MNRTFQAISAMFSLQSLFSNAICSGHKITKYLDCVLSLGSRWIIRTFARSRVFQVRSPSNSPLPHFPCFRRIWPSLLCLISITFGAQNAYAYCWARPAPSEIETLRILTATDPRAAIARAQQQLGNLGSRNGEQVAWLYSVIAGAQFVTNGTSEALLWLVGARTAPHLICASHWPIVETIRRGSGRQSLISATTFIMPRRRASGHASCSIAACPMTRSTKHISRLRT